MEMRIAEEKCLTKTPMKKNKEKQMPDVQTKPPGASSLWGNCSRTVNPYENMAHNTTKVSRDMGSAEEMLGMRYLCVNTVKCLKGEYSGTSPNTELFYS